MGGWGKKMAVFADVQYVLMPTLWVGVRKLKYYLNFLSWFEKESKKIFFSKIDTLLFLLQLNQNVNKLCTISNPNLVQFLLNNLYVPN